MPLSNRPSRIDGGSVLEGTTITAFEEFYGGHEESEDRTKEGTYEIVRSPGDTCTVQHLPLL